jgi:hypothetical protein
MEQGKIYRATYKVYPNTKIKKVDWHGKRAYPLYIQLIYDRRNTVYKSNLFDLYLKPKFGIRVAGELHPPRLEEVIAREEKLVEFIVNKHAEDFSLELFKKEYDYYSRDLLDEMEPGFIFYMHTFFQDEGMPHLADTLRSGCGDVHAADIVLDLKRSLMPDLYGRLIDHSFLYTPYLALFWFAEGNPRRGLTSLILKDWEDKTVQAQFAEYIGGYYRNQRFEDLVEMIEKSVSRRNN